MTLHCVTHYQQSQWLFYISEILLSEALLINCFTLTALNYTVNQLYQIEALQLPRVLSSCLKEACWWGQPQA